MQYHGTRARNTCTRMGHSRVRRTRHASRDLDRLDALDTNHSAKNSTCGSSSRNRHRRIRCARRPRTARACPCWVRLGASGTNHSTASAHPAPTSHSTCSIRSWCFPRYAQHHIKTDPQRQQGRMISRNPHRICAFTSLGCACRRELDIACGFSTIVRVSFPFQAFSLQLAV